MTDTFQSSASSATDSAMIERMQLDADVAALISAAVLPEIAPQRLVNRVRSKLMHAIAEESLGQHSTVYAKDEGWFAFLEKIQFKLLSESEGVASFLLRLEPGAVLPAHHHPVDEECIVLEGDLRIGDRLRMKAGDFHLARKDIPHAEITTDTGALIFLRGAIPTPELVI